MPETTEDRLQYLESQAIELSDVPTKIGDVAEALGIIHAILVDLTKDLDNADEYADDLARLDVLSGLIR